MILNNAKIKMANYLKATRNLTTDSIDIRRAVEERGDAHFTVGAV